MRNSRYRLLRGFFHGEGDAIMRAAGHRQPRLAPARAGNPA
jgi:hypothetical protein